MKYKILLKTPFENYMFNDLSDALNYINDNFSYTNGRLSESEFDNRWNEKWELSNIGYWET